MQNQTHLDAILKLENEVKNLSYFSSLSFIVNNEDLSFSLIIENLNKTFYASCAANKKEAIEHAHMAINTILDSYPSDRKLFIKLRQALDACYPQIQSKDIPEQLYINGDAIAITENRTNNTSALCKSLGLFALTGVGLGISYYLQRAFKP